MDFLKRSWQTVATIAVALGIITGFVTFYSSLATSADLKQLKVELTTEFKKSMDLDRNINRLYNVNDLLMKAKIQQRSRPGDKEIQEDIESLKKQKEDLQQRIEKR